MDEQNYHQLQKLDETIDEQKLLEEHKQFTKISFKKIGRTNKYTKNFHS